MKKTYTTIIAHADNTTTIYTDEGHNLTFNQLVRFVKDSMHNDHTITSAIVSNGRKSVEMVQTFNAITCMHEISKL